MEIPQIQKAIVACALTYNILNFTSADLLHLNFSQLRKDV